MTKFIHFMIVFCIHAPSISLNGSEEQCWIYRGSEFGQPETKKLEKALKYIRESKKTGIYLILPLISPNVDRFLKNSFTIGLNC